MPFARLLPLFLALASAAAAQTAEDFANLREDVRGLTQRVGDLSLRVEQLEHDNGELKQRSDSAGRNYATLAQVNAAVADLSRTLQAAIASSKDETLQQVGAQMEKLARQTNAALDSLGKPSAAPAPAKAVAPAPSGFSDSYPKEGVSYTVQKGDTLALIAKKTGARRADIINANKLADPSKIQAGQELFIPGGK